MVRLLSTFVVVALLSTVLVSPALARPVSYNNVLVRPPPPPPEREPTTLIEWSSWFRLRYAFVDRNGTEALAKRTAPTSTSGRFDGAFGAGLTLPVGSRARLGGWLEFRHWGTPLVGGEVSIVSMRKLDMFWYEGQGVTTFRLGGNPDLLTAQLGFGYQARWDLFADKPRSSSYMIGVRVVATVTQSRYDRGDWTAALGVEFEPLGALRYVAGIRSWYH